MKSIKCGKNIIEYLMDFFSKYLIYIFVNSIFYSYIVLDTNIVKKKVRGLDLFRAKIPFQHVQLMKPSFINVLTAPSVVENGDLWM